MKWGLKNSDRYASLFNLQRFAQIAKGRADEETLRVTCRRALDMRVFCREIEHGERKWRRCCSNSDGKRFPMNITKYLISAVNAEKECSIDKAKSTADDSIKCSWTVKIWRDFFTTKVWFLKDL